MQGYFSRFPEAPQKGRIMLLIEAFRFALTLWPVPEPDLYIDSEDPRLRYVFAVAKHLDAALFLPSGLRDASGRLLYGAEPADPTAIMPAIYHDVPVKPRSERTRADFGSVPNVGDPPPPTAARVARRACALAAVTGRALLEQERLVPRTIDFETMEWHHGACAPKIPFDSHLKTDRCLRPEFALATAEPTRRGEPGWC
jgi:hypothetical protein